MRELSRIEKREQRRIQRQDWKETKREDEKPGFWKQVMQDYNESQAKKEKPYEYKTVRRNKETQRLLEKGWELVDSSGKESLWSGSYKAIMRRPNPRYRGK